MSLWLGPGQGGWKWGVHTHWEANSGSSTNRRPPSPVEASSGAGEELPPHHEAPASPLAELVCCSGHPPAQRIHTGKQTLPGAHRGTRDSSDGMRAAQGDATPGRRQTWWIPPISRGVPHPRASQSFTLPLRPEFPGSTQTRVCHRRGAPATHPSLPPKQGPDVSVPWTEPEAQSSRSAAGGCRRWARGPVAHPEVPVSNTWSRRSRTGSAPRSPPPNTYRQSPTAAEEVWNVLGGGGTPLTAGLSHVPVSNEDTRLTK